MKRYIAIIILVCSSFILTACGALATPAETQEPHIHSFGEWTVTKNATCTEPGEQERLCSCGERQTQSIAATGHNFGDWVIAKAATCTEMGEQERTCMCGEKQTQLIAATGHSFSEWKTVKDTTCTEEGQQERLCSCGEKETKTIAAKGHSFGEWTVSSAPTCTEEGNKTRNCSVCGTVENEVIPATGHSWNEATCTEPKTCSVCHATEGAALGHTGNIGEKCSRCGVTVYPTVKLPNYPINTAYYEYTKGRIDSLNYSFDEYGGLCINYSITKTYQKQKYSSGFSLTGFMLKIVDGDGVLLSKVRMTTPAMSVNEKYIGSWVFYPAVYGKTNSDTIRVIIEDCSH